MLYVDDDRANRVVFEQSFGDDFAVQTVDGGTAALDVMASREVAVVITDIRMPGVSGEQLLRVIKDHYPSTIRMVLTAYSDIDPILRAINEGLVARYIVKPWERNEVTLLLRWAAEAWRFAKSSAELQKRLFHVERLAALGSLIGAIIADLTTPLVSILRESERVAALGEFLRNHSDLVLGAASDDGDRAQLQILLEDLPPVGADLVTSALHLNELVEGLRQFVRPSTNVREIAWSDPLPIVRYAMSVCRPLAMPARALIDYAGPASLPPVRIAASELTQVLINVVANGTQAVVERGRPHGHVTIRALADEDTLEIVVHDDGVGMTPEVLARIGTPFFTTRREGTGLGIAQCQRILGTAGGRFKIESEPGVGTTVTIALPIRAA